MPPSTPPSTPLPHSSALLETLFPEGVITAELRGAAAPSRLLLAEQQCINGVAPKRANEFAAGRLCARFALAQFGIEAFPLLSGADRQPRWPDGVVGCITHTADFCGVVVGERGRFLALGVDTEVVAAVGTNILHQICIAEEVAWLEQLAPEDRSRALSLLFSAKEAFYKCQYPLTGEWLDFADVSIQLPSIEESGTFVVQPQRDLALSRQACSALHCVYRYHDEFVSVGVSLPR